MNFELKRRLFAILFISFFVGTQIFIFAPREAHATVPTWDVGLTGPIPIAIAATNISGFNMYAGHNYDKEFSIANFSPGSIFTQLGDIASSVIPSWDSFAWQIAKSIILVLKNDLIDWIQNGFEGEPLFLQDPEKFFLRFADQASAVFIEDLGVQFAGDPDYFCSDFLPEVVFDMGIYGRRDYFDRARCTITDVVDNIEDYYDDFANGRWSAFAQIQRRQNNRMDFYLMTLQEEATRRYEAEQVFERASASGGGYLPKVDCLEANGVGCRKFRIVSPAKTIADRVTHSVGLDFGQLLTADEMSEVVQALINLAIQEALESLLDA